MEDLRWEPLQQRRENHIFRLTKKCLQGTVPQFFMNYFKYQGDVSSRITRQKVKNFLFLELEPNMINVPSTIKAVWFLTSANNFLYAFVKG